MTRVTASAHLPTPRYLSLRNAQAIEPTNAWTAVSSPSASIRYWFSQLSGLGRALWENSGERTRKILYHCFQHHSINPEFSKLNQHYLLNSNNKLIHFILIVHLSMAVDYILLSAPPHPDTTGRRQMALGWYKSASWFCCHPHRGRCTRSTGPRPCNCHPLEQTNKPGCQNMATYQSRIFQPRLAGKSLPARQVQFDFRAVCL